MTAKEKQNTQSLEFLKNYTLPVAMGIVEKYLIIQNMTYFSSNQVRAAKAMGIA